MPSFYGGAALSLLALTSLRQFNNRNDNLTSTQTRRASCGRDNSKHCNLIFNKTFSNCSECTVDMCVVRGYCPNAISSCCNNTQLEELEAFVNFTKKLGQDLLVYNKDDEIYANCIDNLNLLMDDYVCLTCDNDMKVKLANWDACGEVSQETWNKTHSFLLDYLKNVEGLEKHAKYFLLLPEIYKALYFNT
jgi:hypothetical protein